MARNDSPEGVRTYRAPSGIAVLILSTLFGVFLLGDAVVRGSWSQMLLLAPWVLLGLWLVYEFSFVSMVRIDDSGAVVQNLLRRTTFGWRRVRDIDLRWQLLFSLDDDTVVNCYGGPARARPARPRASDGEAAKAPTSVRDLTEIRDRWEGADGAASDAPIVRTWDGRAIVALAVIVVWAVAAIVIANAG